MLRMDGFTLAHARSWAEASALWHEAHAAGLSPMYVAGGTDLLPNIKHRIFTPKRLVNLSGLRGRIEQTPEGLRLDASVTLAALAADPLIAAHVPALAVAAGLVAGPQIRNMGTIGGNVLLDTRCLYYNQSEFWRQALGYCLKAEGTWCHVVNGPKTCVASQSSDTVPVLLTLDARLHLLSAEGERVLPIRDLYRFNGMDHLAITKGELLTHITLPTPPPGTRGSYHKLRTRDAIDFPQLGLAISGVFDGDRVSSLQIVVGAVNPQPKGIRGLDAFDGERLGAEQIAAIADLVYKQTRPQGSVHGESAWRRQMAVVYTQRGLAAL